MVLTGYNGYKEAWETLDADKVTLLFTEDASYREDPYKDPFQGRESIHDYWTTVTADQKDVDFTFEVLSAVGSMGIAHWHSEFIQPSSGSTIILDGIFILEFSEEGLCRNLREWWHFKCNTCQRELIPEFVPQSFQCTCFLKMPITIDTYFFNSGETITLSDKGERTKWGYNIIAAD